MRTSTNDRATLLAVPALLAGTGYITWRIGWSLGAPAWLAIPLIVAETLALVRFGLQVATRGPRPGPGVVPGAAGSADRRVELLVPAVDAGVEEVARTLAIATRTVSASIRVLDSAQRDDVEAESLRLGAIYEVLDATDAPGLIELARRSSAAEFIAWVDAGDVPVPGLLDLATAFEDRTVAVVQAATNLINRDSLLHLSPERDERAIERNVEGPSLDRAGAAPWNGSGSVIRVAAIEAIGGLPMGRGSATVRATTRLVRHGYAVRFCGLPLVRTVAPDNLDEYLAEAADRASGAWAAMWSSDSPLHPGPMPLRARLAQIHAATTPLDGAIRFTYLAVLAAVLFSGQLPIGGSLGLAAAIFIPQLVLRGAVGIALSRGNTSLGEPTRQSLRLMGVHLGALVGKQHRRDAGAGVARLSVLGRLPLLTGLEIVLDVALLLRGLTFIWPTMLPPFSDAARVLVMSAAVWAIVPIIDVLQVLVTRTQRRQFHRTGTELVAEIDGRVCQAVDLTPRGIGVVMSEPIAPDTAIWVRLDLPSLDGATRHVAARALVRHSTVAWEGAHRVGARFTDLEPDDRDALVEYCALTAEHRDQTRAEATASTPEQLIVGGHGGRRTVLGALSVVGALLAGLVVIAGPSPAGAAPMDGGGSAVVSGTVVDDSGTPLANMCISLQGQNGAGWGWAFTDQDGNYTAWAIMPGDYKVNADDCSGNGTGTYVRTYRPSTAWEQDAALVTVADSDALAGIDITMQRSSRLRATVVDDNGDPLQNVCFSFMRTDGSGNSNSNNNWWWMNSTDQNGTLDASLPADASGKLQLRDCTNEGRFYENWFPDTEQDSAQVITTSAGGDQDLGQLTVHSGAIIRGTITDLVGEPLQGVCVNASLVTPTNWQWKGGTSSDADGSYRFNIRPGTYTLQMSDCSGHQDIIQQFYNGGFTWTDNPPSVTVSAGDNGSFDLAMTTGGHVRGHLTDTDGNDVTGACIGLHPKATFDADRWDTASWTSVNQDGSWTSNAVAPGDYYIQYRSCDPNGGDNNNFIGQWVHQFHPDVLVENGGELGQLVSVHVDAGQTTSGVDDQLVRAARLTGVVRDATGTPIEHICVGSGSGRLANSDNGDDDSGTRADGIYGGSMAPGTYTVVFSDCSSGRGFVQLTQSVTLVGGGDQTLDVTLQAGPVAKIAGSLRNDRGTPLQPACAVAYVPDSIVGFGLVQPDGTFSIEGLGNGSYWIGAFNCEDPATPFQDPDTAGVALNASWYGVPNPVPIETSRYGPPDPAASGATAVVVAGVDFAGIDFCLGAACSPSAPATTTPPTTVPPTTVPPTTTPPTSAPEVTTPGTTGPAPTVPQPNVPQPNVPVTVAPRPVVGADQLLPDLHAVRDTWANVESASRIAPRSKRSGTRAPEVLASVEHTAAPPPTTPLAAIAAVQAAISAPTGAVNQQVVAAAGSGGEQSDAVVVSTGVGSAAGPNGNRTSLMLAGLSLMIVAAGALVLVWRRQRAADALV